MDVLFGMTDEEYQASEEIEQEAAHRVRHQLVNGAHRDVAEKPDEARVEEAGDAKHQRQADEMDDFRDRPDPRHGHDGVRQRRRLQPGSQRIQHQR